MKKPRAISGKWNPRAADQVSGDLVKGVRQANTFAVAAGPMAPRRSSSGTVRMALTLPND